MNPQRGPAHGWTGPHGQGSRLPLAEPDKTRVDVIRALNTAKVCCAAGCNMAPRPHCEGGGGRRGESQLARGRGSWTEAGLLPRCGAAPRAPSKDSLEPPPSSLSCRSPASAPSSGHMVNSFPSGWLGRPWPLCCVEMMLSGHRVNFECFLAEQLAVEESERQLSRWFCF